MDTDRCRNEDRSGSFRVLHGSYSLKMDLQIILAIFDIYLNMLPQCLVSNWTNTTNGSSEESDSILVSRWDHPKSRILT